MSRLWICALLVAPSACGDDGPRESFVYTNDAGDGDGDGDVDDEDAGGRRERKGYERFCRDTVGGGYCTEDELRPALDCYNDACHLQYMQCDLPCSSYIKCLDACDCADRRCVASCETAPECIDCRSLVECADVKMCVALLPACAFEERDHSCTELETCCADLRGSARTECEGAVQQGDMAWCSTLYRAFCAQPS